MTGTPAACSAHSAWPVWNSTSGWSGSKRIDHCPSARCKEKNPLGVLLDLRGDTRAVDIGQRQRLVAEVDHVLDLALRDQLGHARIFRRGPGVPGDFVRADERRVAVGLVGRQFVAAGVVEIQILGDAVVKAFAALAGDLVFVDIQQVRHAAEHVGRRGDHARPDRALLLEAVERPRIVVEALRQELELLPLTTG